MKLSKQQRVHCRRTHYWCNITKLKTLVLSCDASQYSLCGQYGLRAVLSHAMDNGKGKPVAYAARTPAEKNYSQIKKDLQ